MQQPPAETQISPVGLKVVAIGVIHVVVVVVLEADGSLHVCWWRCSQGNDRRQIIPAAQQIELDTSEEREQGKGIQERESPGDGADLHLVPQLCLALFALPLAACLYPSSLKAAQRARALASNLTGMNIALALKAGTLCVVIGGFGHARGCCTGNLAGPYAASETLSFLLLQLFEDLFDGNGVEDIFGGGGEDGEDGEGAVFLVLLETAAEAGSRQHCA